MSHGLSNLSSLCLETYHFLLSFLIELSRFLLDYSAKLSTINPAEASKSDSSVAFNSIYQIVSLCFFFMPLSHEFTSDVIMLFNLHGVPAATIDHLRQTNKYQVLNLCLFGQMLVKNKVYRWNARETTTMVQIEL